MVDALARRRRDRAGAGAGRRMLRRRGLRVARQGSCDGGPPAAGPFAVESRCRLAGRRIHRNRARMAAVVALADRSWQSRAGLRVGAGDAPLRRSQAR